MKESECRNPPKKSSALSLSSCRPRVSAGNTATNDMGGGDRGGGCGGVTLLEGTKVKTPHEVRSVMVIMMSAVETFFQKTGTVRPTDQEVVVIDKAAFILMSLKRGATGAGQREGRERWTGARAVAFTERRVGQGEQVWTGVSQPLQQSP